MEQERSTGLVGRKLSYLVLVLAVFSFAAKPVLAQETVCGPEDLRIGWFRLHLSFQNFTVDEQGEGTIIISKNTPGRKIRGGFARLNGKWIPLQSFLAGGTTVLEKSVHLRTRNYLFVLLRGDRGASISVEVRKKSLTPPPEVNFSANPTAIKLGESSELSWAVTHATTVEIEPGIGTVDSSGFYPVSPSETTSFSLTAEGEGGVATSSVSVTVYQPPTVSFSAEPETVLYGEKTTLYWGSTNADKVVIDQNIGEVSNEGSLEIKPDRTTTYTITASGLGGSVTAQTAVAVKADVEPQPEGSFGEKYQDQIPPDATIGEYDPKRFSLITGLVQDLDNLPIADVSIAILNHPECGTAVTDTNGLFSLPVEGGGTNTVVYQKNGLISAQRKVYVGWNDIAVAETIQMTAEDPASTTFTFDGNASTVDTHESTEVSDEFGSRSLTMVLTGNNGAYEVDAQGNVIQELTTITTRATEFPTPESMPAILPPTSAFTYCAELTVDGVQRVRFDKPVVIWVDNFLGFDVGEAVPVGYYDRDRGVWVAEENGKVVRLLASVTGGVVDALDATGDGAPDDLDGDGVFSDEVLGLDDSVRYPAGSTFWRAELTHFSPVDWNWPSMPMFAEADPDPNPGGPPVRDGKLAVCKDCGMEKPVGSFVEERSRIFHEDIAIPGTDIALHYSSDRVQGYQHKITVPASGDTVPASLKRIIVRLEVAGRSFEQALDPLPNQMAEFVWDGLDHVGRQVSGSATAHVSLGFVYDAVYSRAANLVRAFGQPGREATLISSRQELVSWQRSKIALPRLAKKGNILAEGWTLSPHHYLNPTDTSILHKGDGTQAVNQAIIVDTVAGGGSGGYPGGEIPATDIYLSLFEGVATDSEGNFYIANGSHNRIYKVDREGMLTSVAGNGYSGFSGDGGPATQARLYRPKDVVLDSEGNIYIADASNRRVRKVETSGIITTVAGNGSQYYGGDGVPATQSGLNHPKDVGIDTAGNLYIADYHAHRVYKVDPKGIITTFAGNGQPWSGDGGPATEAGVPYPSGLALDREGNLYIAHGGSRIRKVDTSGTITTVAGNGSLYASGDGGPATEAGIGPVEAIEVDMAGNLYLSDHYNKRIRKVDTSGIIITFAGDGTHGFSGDGGAATQAQFKEVYGVAVDPVGNLYVVDSGNNRVRKVSLPYVLLGSMEAGDIAFAEENGLGHVLSSSGQHKTTIDLDTRAVLQEFAYDEENRLVAITDQFGNQTIINRDSSGVPTSITSPDGITTELSIDEDNHLTRITYPDGNYYSFEYPAGGLLTAKVEPEGNLFTHGFDSTGRLATVTDEEGGNWEYSRTASESGEVMNEVLTGEGDLTSYVDFTDSTGAYTSTITDPTGSVTSYSQSGDGLNVNKSLPCGMDLEFEYGLDSEYKFKFVKEMTESTPAGLTKTTLRDKTYQDTDSDNVPDRITETVTVNGKATTLVTDTLQSTKTITSPVGRSVTTHYDPVTLVTTSLSIPGLFDTTYGYDINGRLTSIATDFRQTTFSYDAQGNLASITDPENHTTTYLYDAVGRMTGISRPDTSSVSFSYDRNGNMTVLTNPATIDHSFGYNLVNLNSSYSTPLSGSYSYVYDRDRRLTQVNFPSGKQINNFYADGNLVQIQTPEGNVDLAYSCSTKVDSITKGSEIILYDYDGSLVIGETSSGTLNASLDYTYNNDFNLSSFTYAGGTVGYYYDNDGLLTGSGSFTISRNSGNGLPESVTGGAFDLGRTFNGYGEVEAQDFTVGSQGVTSWSLTRDNAGRITHKTETVDGITSNYSYTYDPMGRLLTVTKDDGAGPVLVEEYQYDSVGTRTYEMNLLRGIAGREFTYDPEDHLLTAGDAAYEYETDGYLKRKTLPTETPGVDDITTYSYSSRGELLSVTLPGDTEIYYVHDPLGRRIAKKVDDSITEKYLWQGLTRLLAVYDGNDLLLTRFLYADGRMPVAMEQGSAIYYLTYDQVGSLRVVADSSGNVVKRIDYDSFGNITNDTDPSFEIPFGFAGGLHDRDTGLVRFGFRDYDPDIGRWTAKDPILFQGGQIDLYGYCLNDPVNWADPYGLAIAETAGISIGIGGPIGGVIGAAIPLLIYGTATGHIPFDTPETLVSPYKSRKKKDPRILAKEKAKLKKDNPCEPPQQEDPEKDPPPSIEPTKEQQLRREPLWAKIWRAITSQYDPTTHY